MPKDKIEEARPIVVLGAIMIVISVVGIVMVCCVKATMNRICVGIEIFILLVISIVLIIFGAFLVIPAVYGTGYVNENCEYGQAG